MNKGLAWALLAIAAFGGGSAARAQTPPQDLPRVVSELRVEADHNGVNLVSGRTQFELPVLSVPAAPNLRFDRIQNAAPYILGRVSGQAEAMPVGNWSIHTPGATESFVCVDWMDCGSVTGTGSYFRGPAGAYGAGGTYRQAGTGAVWTFAYGSAFGPGPVRQSYASNVNYPGGERITYSYDDETNLGQTIYRPTRIASNLGYFIAIAYPTNDLGSPYWGSPAEVAIYREETSPTPPTLLGRLTYSYSGDDVTVTDLAGRTYSCTSCRNSLGSDVAVWSGSSRLPGDGAPNRLVVERPTLPFVGSVTQDGVQYGYDFTFNGGAPYLHRKSNSYWFTRLAVTGPAGFNQVYTFIQSGQRNVLTSSVDSLGRTTSYLFDPAYRPTRIVYPEGNRVDVVYDASGNVTSRTATPKPGSGLAPITETANYLLTNCAPPNIAHVDCWRPSWSRDALGRQTDYLYNSFGQMTEQTEPADAAGVRRRTIVDYTPSPVQGISRATAVRLCGVGTTCGTNQEIRTEYQYLGETRLVTRERRIDPATGAVLDTNYAYDPAGRVLAVDGPVPGTDDATYSRYDVLGRKTWEIGARAPNGLRIATRYTYRDSDDRPVSRERGTLPDEQSSVLTVFQWTDVTYDSRRNPIREAVSAGGTTYSVIEASFDDRGRMECQARRMNPAIFGSPPASACVPGAEGGHGPDRISRNIYDAAGQRLQAREGVGSAIEGATATWAYNLNGQIVTIIDGNGNRAELRYDGHGRQTCWLFPSPTRPQSFDDSTPATALATAGGVNGNCVNSGDFELYAYDAAGNRTSLRKRDGSTLTFQYDNLNRMIAKIVPERAGLDPTHTRDVYYGYDLRNAQLYARFDSASGEGVTNAYDGFGRPVSSTLLMDGTPRTIGRAYDDANNRLALTHPDGAVFTYAHDVLGRLTGLYQGAGLVTPLASFAYTAQGLPQSRVEGTGSGIAYAHDSTGRLISLVDTFNWSPANGTATFAYNPAGQIVSRSQSNDGYAWAGTYTVNRPYTTNGLNQYSAAGTATFSYDANGNLTSDGSANFTYDVENRLVAAGGSRTAALRYDPLGRLYEVVGATTTRLLHDGDALVAEYDLGGTLTHRYVHGSNAGADDPLVWYGNGTIYWLHSDHQGSITAIANIDGNLLWLNAYDEYGIPRAGNTGRFQYTGQAWIGELGMYYYKARIYSPTLGRFLQTDPVGYQDQFNLYAYVGNDPINASDPSGAIICSNNTTKCEQVHEAAREARGAVMAASVQLRGIVGAMSSGTELTTDQQALVGAFEKRFGAGSATPAALSAAATHFDRIANRIGERGQGARIRFRTNSQMDGHPANAPNSSTINIGPKFFGENGGMNGLTQAYVILHEGGHLVGPLDRLMPANAPHWMGRGPVGDRRAYGVSATNWLGIHRPDIARRNNDSYTCFVMPQCGGP